MIKYAPTEWKNRIVDGEIVVQEGTPLSAENLNKIEQMLSLIAHSLGQSEGIATLNQNGVVPSEQLPSNLKEMRIVSDIQARDQLEKFEGLRVLVTNATADETVNEGWAEYVFNGLEFVKVGEGESLDVVISWDTITNKPTTFTPSAHSHKEADIIDLDKYSKNEIDDKLLLKADKQSATTTNDGLMTATDKTSLVQAISDIATLLTHLVATNNPHSVTKEQIGLNSVQNYGIATLAQAQSGAANNVYMTPIRVKNSIDKFVPTNLSGFTNDKNFVSSNASQITVSSTAPTNPSTNDIWIVT